MSELLEMRGIEIQFPGVKALDKVDFTLRAGEVHALLGENGAGKSTLIKCLTGVNKMDAGEILLEGKVHPTHFAAWLPSKWASPRCFRRSTSARTSPWLKIYSSVASR